MSVRYLKPVPFGSENYHRLAAAIKRTSPQLTIHLISDRTNEIVNMEEAMAPRYQAVGSWPVEKYLSPFMSPEESNGVWRGFYHPESHEIKSSAELKSADQDGWIEFACGFIDIRHFIYDMTRGVTFPIYDLFAVPDCFLDGYDDDCLISRREVVSKLRALAGKCYSVRSAMGRYTGSLDGLFTKIKRTIEYYDRRDAAIAADPLVDLKTVRPISYDVPTNSAEVYEVLSIFVGTWLRANLVFKFLDARRKAKTDDEFSTVQNELVTRWWRRDENSYTDDELFQFATKNLLMRSFLVASQVKDIRGVGYTPGLEYSTDDLAELVEAMASITNDLRARIGDIPASRSNHNAEAISLCYEIIDLNHEV